MNQIRSLVSTAPADLRERLRALTIVETVRTCAGFRPSAGSDVDTTTKVALRVLARRVQYLDTEIAPQAPRRPRDLQAPTQARTAVDDLRSFSTVLVGQ